MIEGDGDHDRLIDVSVSAVAPSWRADSLALAYAGSKGQVIVRDLSRGRTTVMQPRGCPSGRVKTAQVAFAPRGALLAASIGSDLVLVADPAQGWATCNSPVSGMTLRSLVPPPPPQVAWISGRELVASTLQWVARMAVRGHHLARVAEAEAPSGINGLAVSPDRRQIALGLWQDDGLHLVVAEMPRSGNTQLDIVWTLRGLPAPSAITSRRIARLSGFGCRVIAQAACLPRAALTWR
jgi:hypothetical protein